MSTIAEQKCPGCGAAMRYDPQQGKLICDFCGAVAEIPPETAEESEEEVAVQGFDFDALSHQAEQADAQGLPVYLCRSCGAEVITPAEQAALTCPYCGNNIVLTEKVTGKLRPDGVVPFQIDAKGLPDAMTRFFKDKALLPKGFFSQSTMEKVTGVYVPFWVFNGRMTGALRFDGQKSRVYRRGDYEITETAHYQVVRDVDLPFNNVPVDASGRIDDALMDSLEPFRMEEAKPFDMRYLAGFTADRFDRAREEVAERARERMVSTAEKAAEASVAMEYELPRRTGGSLSADLSARYLLLPVYLFELAHGGKRYAFAVNGQTGKVVGELPTDKGVSFRYFLLRALIPAAVIGAIVLIRYLLGG